MTGTEVANEVAPVAFDLTLPDSRRASAQVEDHEAKVTIEGTEILDLARSDRGVFDGRGGLGDAIPPEALLPLLAAVFTKRPRVETVSLLLTVSESWARGALRGGVFQSIEPIDGRVRLHATRGGFWQHPALWLKGTSSATTPLAYVMTGEKRHPVRPVKPVGEIYRRHMPRFNADFSLRTLDLASDLETFNRWMNLESVAEFWNERGSTAEHQTYLEKVAGDPHTLTLMGCFDDEPFAYFEMYWAKEDRIAPFYAVDDYDRGLHLLVGDPRHQGPGKVEAWFRAILHFMFLDDPRTQRLVGDPRVDHTRWIEYMQKQGFMRIKQFDLPHKRSELIMIERETFFGPPWGGP